MFKKNLPPSLRIKIAKATQIPTFLGSISKILAAARARGFGAKCRAICADEGIADSWVAFARTLGVTPVRSGLEVTFEVAAPDMEKLVLPRRSVRGPIAAAKAAGAGTK